MPQGRGNVELFKSVRLMMAEGRFIQAERTLLDYSLQHEEQLSIDFFHELFEVRRLRGSDFPFSELHSYFKKLADKNKFQEINELLTWWTDKNPSFESVDLYQWKLRLAEIKGHLQGIEENLKSLGMLILSHKYWPHIELYKSYYERYFKNNYDLVFVLILYHLQTHQFDELEKIFYQFVNDQIIKSKRTAKIDDDIDLILTLLNQSSSKGFLEVWKSFFHFLQVDDFDDVEIKKIIETFIYFDSQEMQLVLLRRLHQWGQTELVAEFAQTIKKMKSYDFVMIEKYFSHDLKGYFFQKKKEQKTEFKSLLSVDDLKLESKYDRDEDKEESERHLLSEEESLIISGLKYQQFSLDQGLDLMVSMIQMNFPLAAREIGLRFRSANLEDSDRLKLNYLLLQIFHYLKDYRAGLDVALDSLSIASTAEDILAFTYAEADFYFMLGEKQRAKTLYLSILNLVGNYRMTKQRLKELDET